MPSSLDSIHGEVEDYPLKTASLTQATIPTVVPRMLITSCHGKGSFFKMQRYNIDYQNAIYKKAGERERGRERGGIRGERSKPRSEVWEGTGGSTRGKREYIGKERLPRKGKHKCSN